MSEILACPRVKTLCLVRSSDISILQQATIFSGHDTRQLGSEAVLLALIARREATVEAVTTAAPKAAEGTSFLGRHQFLIYRLFSLAGIIPIGGYVVMHLAVNASVLAGPAMYQQQVDKIHSLGDTAVMILEWAFIFIPILFHATVGFWIISGALPNTGAYPYGSNIRYTLQRGTAFVVACFILFHLWQMHHLGHGLGGGKFNPEHAASSAAIALSPLVMKIIYTVGTLCAVYHLANGIWTWGITWGLWTSEKAQKRAGYLCTVIGLTVAFFGMGTLYGMSRVNVEEAEKIENRIQTMREAASGEISLPATTSTEK
jgi:succinate dehydrogenase / fumarate reductase cytochrome b subunit